MTKPTYQQSHTDVALTNISIAYSPGEYIGESVFPRVPVTRQSDKYYTYDKGDWLRDDAGVRAPGGLAPIVSGYGLTTNVYTALERALSGRVPQESIDNADNPLSPLEDMTRFVTEKIYLRKEKAVASIAFGAGEWSSSATPGTLWSNDTSDPIGDVETAACAVKLSIAKSTLRGVMGYEVWSKVKNHPDIVDRIKGAAGPGNPAVVSKMAVAALFELEDILVGTALENTGAEGASDTIVPVWGKHFLIFYRPATPSLLTPSAGYVFTYLQRSVDRFTEEQRDAFLIRVRESYDVKKVAADCGYRLVSVVT